jgi:hypothetical protein
MKRILGFYRHTIFFLVLVNSSFGQTSCSKDKITGNWRYTNSFRYIKSLKIDSLVQASEKSKQTFGFWTFNNDGTYIMKIDTILNRKSKGHFTTNEDKCEIRLGRKKRTPEGLIFHILFIDEKYLILKCRKPNGDFVYLYKRG